MRVLQSDPFNYKVQDIKSVCRCTQTGMTFDAWEYLLLLLLLRTWLLKYDCTVDCVGLIRKSARKPPGNAPTVSTFSVNRKRCCILRLSHLAALSLNKEIRLIILQVKSFLANGKVNGLILFRLSTTDKPAGWLASDNFTACKQVNAD